MMQTRCVVQACRILNLMTLYALLLGLQPVPLSIDKLNELAANRDVEGLYALSIPDELRPTAFQFLKTGGVYGGGRRGWAVKELKDPVGERRYAVFSADMSCEDIGEQVFELRGDKIGRAIDERETFNLKLTHHDFTVRMDPSNSTVFIEDNASFKSTGSATPFFHVRFGPEWRVKEIKDSAGKPVAFGQGGGTVSVSRPATKDFSLKFTYEAVLDRAGLDGKMRADELMLGGACWWPSLARQASTTKATIITPKDWRAFSHGGRLSESVAGDLRTTVWDNPLPISVLSLAAGKYEVAQSKVGRLTFWSASIFEPKAVLQLQNEVNAGIIGFYETISPWPYSSWGSLISERFVGGALEAYSYASYARGWLPDIDPHETAHTFWGGVIPNTYLKSLWNESFASYFEQYYYREGCAGNRVDLRRAFRDIPDVIPAYRTQPAATAGAETGGSASPIGYTRGGLVLDMLESEIGESAMRDSMSKWLKTHPRGTTGEWEDFERVVLQVSKRDVRWFFDQWIRKAGWADFEITDVTRNETKAGWETTGTIRFNGGPYRLRFEVLVTSADGKDQIIQLPLTTGKTSETLRFTTKTKPKSITFDPWHRVMRDIDRASLPSSIRGSAGTNRPWMREGDETMAEQLLGDRARQSGREFPTDLNRKTLVADPRKSPEMVKLLKLLPDPPAIQGNRIVWRGQAVDMSKGGFAAVINLPEGQRCTVMFGSCRLRPQFGQANAVLFDDLGRPKAATRAPSRSGALHFELEPSVP